jgi:hypothetical protein
LGEGGGEALGEGVLGPGAAAETMGLFLLPTGQPGRRFIAMDDEAATAGSFDLFLLSRGRPRPRFSTGAPMFRCEPLASAMEDKCLEKKTLDEMRETEAMRRRKTVMKELGFFPSQRALFISKL